MNSVAVRRTIIGRPLVPVLWCFNKPCHLRKLISFVTEEVINIGTLGQRNKSKKILPKFSPQQQSSSCNNPSLSVCACIAHTRNTLQNPLHNIFGKIRIIFSIPCLCSRLLSLLPSHQFSLQRQHQYPLTE